MRDIIPVMDLQLVQRNGRKLINGSFTLAQTLQVVPIKVVLHFEKPDSTRLHVLDFTGDACDFLNGAFNKQTVAKLVLKELNKQKKFPKKCPMEKVRKKFTCRIILKYFFFFIRSNKYFPIFFV